MDINDSASNDSGPTGSGAGRYVEPGWFTRRIFNPMVRGLTSLGVSIGGSRVLEVRGRKSGNPQRTPVNLLELDGGQYLVSPRGNGQWVRNVRAAGGRLDLLVGKRRDHWVATELGDDEKPQVLREYLRRWKAEVGVFDGVDANSSDEELLHVASNHPVFRLKAAA